MGIENQHNGSLPKSYWLLRWEQTAIIQYAQKHYAHNDYHLKDGYRRLTYQMLDLNLVAVSPSSVYRILKAEGLLNRWNTTKKSTKGTGFVQPQQPHQHWHTDIKYVNFQGTFLFLISVLDGYSRYVLHHQLRTHMTEYDVELTVQKAHERYPEARPKLISDNGSVFVSKDFQQFIKALELVHIKTSVAYPQSNGKIERFHRSLNSECLNTQPLIDLEQARRTIAQYIDYYNKERLHSALFYLTPEDFLLGRVEQRLEEREEKLQQAVRNRQAFWTQLPVQTEPQILGTETSVSLSATV